MRSTLDLDPCLMKMPHWIFPCFFCLRENLTYVGLHVSCRLLECIMFTLCCIPPFNSHINKGRRYYFHLCHHCDLLFVLVLVGRKTLGFMKKPYEKL